MSPRIQILPDHVANQIAAGEVVERPASVVKELVENALDAEASRVEVRLRNGGKTEIRVSDDGIGMERQDALLALDRHATSKIEEADDLHRISTLGFRGEALPSIAAVSRFELETSTDEGEVGTRVRARAGRIGSVDEVARRPGTTVTVRALFQNVPARAKFLKSASAETRACSEAVTLLALSNLGVAFRLESNGRELLDLPAVDALRDRVADLWGGEEAGELVPVDREADDARVGGLIQRPDAARPGGHRRYLFVNGRPFRDKGLNRTVDGAYRTTVPPGAHPTFLLYLSLPPAAVDMNVHPAKAEVRFRDRERVEEALTAAVRDRLASLESTAPLGREAGAAYGRDRGVEEGGAPAPDGAPASGDGGGDAADGAGGGPTEPRRDETREAVGRTGAPSGGEGPRRSAGGPGLAAPSGGATAGTPPELEGRPDLGEEARSPDEAPESQLAFFVPEGEGDQEPPSVERGETVAASRPELWQLHQSYILAATRQGLLIIDQHAAHERVLFEEVMARFDGEQEGASQRLLFPVTVRLSPAEYSAVEELHGLLSRVGFEVSPFGDRTAIIHASPNPHPYFDAERCFREMVDELTHGSPLVDSARNQHERIAKSLACKGAIKAGQPLTQEEMTELFDRLFATELPGHDVHGRPTIVRLGMDELERRFGRT